MPHFTALYFDGTNARPYEVRVMVLKEAIEIYSATEEEMIQQATFTGMFHHQIKDTCYFYLDAKGLQYLQVDCNEVKETGLLQQLSIGNPNLVQKLMKQKIPVLLLTVLVLSGALYFLLIFFIPLLGMKLISPKQETKIGSKLKEVMLQESALIGIKTDSAGTVQLQAFADKLHLSKAYPIRVTLLKNEMVNAFALPGGHVVVYSGIIKKMDSPESLAALLAHESVHINERHSLKSLLRNAANSILISVVFGDITGISGALAGNANTLNGLRYSRSLEEEADTKGMELLVQNNLEVKGMLQLMQALKAEADIPQQLSFLSSHPLTDERIKATESFIKKHPQKEKPNNDLQLLFDQLKQ